MMREVNWATPDVIGRMTPAQLNCLLQESPTGDKPKLESFAEYQAVLAERQRRDEEWNS